MIALISISDKVGVKEFVLALAARWGSACVARAFEVIWDT